MKETVAPFFSFCLKFKLKYWASYYTEDSENGLRALFP